MTIKGTPVIHIVPDMIGEDTTSPCIHRPRHLRCVRMLHDFEIMTDCGLEQGNQGDYILINDNNELSICSQKYFNEHYIIPTGDLTVVQ